MVNKSNGNALSADSLKDKKIEFPVTFELKAVMVEDGDHTGNKEKLEAVFVNSKLTSFCCRKDK